MRKMLDRAPKNDYNNGKVHARPNAVPRMARGQFVTILSVNKTRDSGWAQCAHFLFRGWFGQFAFRFLSNFSLSRSAR